MKILFTIPSLSSGGAERVLSAMANHWAELGHDITILTLDSPKASAFYTVSNAINIMPLNLATPEKSSLLKRVSKIFTRLHGIRKTINLINPNCIVSFIDIMNVTTLIATWGLKIPVIVSERIDPHYHAISPLYNMLRTIFYFFSSKVVVQTESSLRYFPKMLEKNMVIIPNPVPSPFLRTIIHPEVKKIISVGRLEKQKDHQTLLYAVKEVTKIFPNIVLEIYGEGSERKNLEYLVNKLSLYKNVFLNGTEKNIQQKLSEADLFVFPSLYEGFPNALCEAMSVGLPVIASNCMGNVDIIKDRINGRLFPVGNTKALSKVMLELMNNMQQRQELSQAALEVTKDFNSEDIFSKWDTLVKMSISGKAIPLF